MPKLVYVTEYESSSAQLKIGDSGQGSDPIYRASSNQKALTVGVPSPLVILGIAGLGALVIYFLVRA